MTNEVIEPGRKLDAKVAAELGIDWDEIYGPDWIYNEEEGEEIQIYDTDVVLDEVLHYSTDIAAAWALVEKAAEMGYAYTVGYVPMADRGMKHIAIFQKKEIFLCPQFSREGDTAPHAICLAFLALKE